MTTGTVRTGNQDDFVYKKPTRAVWDRMAIEADHLPLARPVRPGARQGGVQRAA